MNIYQLTLDNKIFLNKHFCGWISHEPKRKQFTKRIYKRRKLNGENSLASSGSKVDLNNLIKRVKEEEKRSKRQNLVISAAALSAVAAFGIILTL